MTKKTLSYQSEKDGAVAEYIAQNPVHYRRNWPDHIEILTGDDIPQESAVDPIED
jgi:hypothetical protein